ncbi:hypothetical protein F4808DRAFT_469889 [Astrocystis sublimbata]|nr:hypothetical protein F4808DRAFT_469889 [Astrocystis sublimbata]
MTAQGIEAHANARHIETREHVTLELLKRSEHEYHERLTERILSTLRFSLMNARENQIKLVSEDTAAWIFDRRKSGAAAEDAQLHFAHWLEVDDPIFWISGKPGSGKSSLMKFLLLDHRTKDHLSKWKPDVTICRYFFIELCEHPLQREFRGCLRALLCQILHSKPHLFSPLLQQRPDLAEKHSEHDWSEEELRDVFLLTLRLAASPVCLFIDRLDEIAVKSDDRDSIIGLLKDLSNLEYTKICVSSRPETIFKETLGSYPHLQTQDLNGPAIDLYVKNRLVEYKPSSPVDLNEYNRLISAVNGKASGVFLWAVLATQSIVLGIRGGDSWYTLLHRTEKLDPDLHSLFQQMLERQSDNTRFYKEETARLLWHSLHGNNAPRLWNISTLPGYVFGTHAELRSDLLRSLNSGERSTEETQVYERYRKWLSARSAGLLEINKSPFHENESSELSLIHYDVNFIHRSVQEFLLDTTAGRDVLLNDHSSSKERLLRTAGAMKDMCVYLAHNGLLFLSWTALLEELALMGYLNPQEEAGECLDIKGQLQSRAPEIFSDFYILKVAAMRNNAQFVSVLSEGVDKLPSEKKSTLLSEACRIDFHIGMLHGWGPTGLELRVTGSKRLKGNWTAKSIERRKHTISLLLRIGANPNAKLTAHNLGFLTISKTPFHELLTAVLRGLNQRKNYHIQFSPRLASCVQELEQYNIDWELPFYFCSHELESSEKGGILLFEHPDKASRPEKWTCVFKISARELRDFLDRVNSFLTPSKMQTELITRLSVELHVQCVAVNCREIDEASMVAQHKFQPPDPNHAQETRQLEEIIRKRYLMWLWRVPDENEDRTISSVMEYVKLLSEYVHHEREPSSGNASQS